MTDETWSADDVSDQHGKVAVVTGATSGLGKETARVLALKGATVVLAVRNAEKGAAAAEDLRAAAPGAEIEVRALDLADLASVRAFAETFAADRDRLDMLINNAGVMFPPYTKTVDGFELQMGTNHFGHFALTGRLMPLLKQTPGARVVTVASLAHRGGKIAFDDLDWDTRPYKASQAYCDSKIANLHFTQELAERLSGTGVLAAAAHPGWTVTELQRHSSLAVFFNPVFGQKVERGALPTIRAAVDAGIQPNDFVGPDGFLEMRGAPVKVTPSKRAHDAEIARKLWAISEERTGVAY